MPDDDGNNTIEGSKPEDSNQPQPVSAVAGSADGSDGSKPKKRTSLKERAERPMNRRELLRGAFLQEDAK